ncbi:MAG: hypothetical protein H0V89_11350 [Deltaproteobacteria bacterium]|nr:hypothetical protein [Deltaproteobacteria bacterium]
MSFLIALLIPPAAAEPNDLCPGFCPDLVTACGEPADCSGEVCTFEDSCLPGLSGLVTEVVPESPNDLNDYASPEWLCGWLVCAPTPDELAYSSAYGSTVIGIKEFMVAPGRKYLVRASLGADAGTWGFIDVVGGAVWENSATVTDAAVPVQLELLMDVPADHVGPISLRIHADGPGWMHLSDIVILELVDYEVWLRFAAPGAASHVDFSDGFIQRHLVTSGLHGYYPVPCAPGALGPTCIDPRLTEATAEVGAFSDWVEVSAMFSGGWRASHAWAVLDGATGAPLDGATVQVQMAWAPDEAAIVWDDTRTLIGHTAGIVLPDGIPNPSELLTHQGWIADEVLSDHDALLADPAWQPAAQPITWWTGTIFNTIDLFDDYAAVEDSLEMFADVGFNRRSFLGSEPTQAQEDRATALGLTKDLLHAESLLAPWNYLGVDYDLALLRSTADANLVNVPYYAATAEDFQTRPEDLFVVLGDEIGGLPLVGPLYTAGFHDFLVAEGFVPADFGVADWGAIAPLSNMGWWLVTSLRPDPIADPDAAKLFYWQMRWWNEATAQGFRQAMDALVAQPDWGAAYPASHNAGMPQAGYYYSFARGVEFQTMARAGAVSALLGEGFLLYRDVCLGQQLAYFADFTAGQARPWGLPMHGYVHGHRGDHVSKMLTLASRGYGYFNTYSYGPYDLSTGDGVGGLGELSVPWLSKVTASNHALAQAEPWLLGAVRPPAPIAILAAQSDAIWTELGAGTFDESGWHQAWSHAHHAVDVVVEDQLANELAGRSILLVTRAHLSATAWDAVRDWVEAGGTLVVGPGLPLADEYGQLVQARADWLEISSGPTSLDPATVTWSGAAFEVATSWAALTSDAPAIATYATGETAAVRVDRGAGHVVAVGFPLGDVYMDPAVNDCYDGGPPGSEHYPTGFSEAVLAAAAGIATEAGVDALRTVDVDDPLVEVVRVDRADGGAILATSYQDEPVTVTITALGLPAEVTEALSGTTLTVSGDTVVVTLDKTAVIGWVLAPPDEEEPDPTEEEPEPPTGAEPTLDEDEEPEGPVSEGEPDPKGCGCETGRPGVALAPLLALAGLLRRRRPAGFPTC